MYNAEQSRKQGITLFSYHATEAVFYVTEAFWAPIRYFLIANLYVYVVEYLRRMWYYTYIDVNKDHLLARNRS